MKKTLLIAMVGIVLMAFTSCTPKSTKQFNESKATLEQLQQQVEAVTTCEELQLATDGVNGLTNSTVVYADNEKMTAEEQATFTQMLDSLNVKMQAKFAELGCGQVVDTTLVDSLAVDTTVVVVK